MVAWRGSPTSLRRLHGQQFYHGDEQRCGAATTSATTVRRSGRRCLGMNSERRLSQAYAAVCEQQFHRSSGGRRHDILGSCALAMVLPTQ